MKSALYGTFILFVLLLPHLATSQTDQLLNGNFFELQRHMNDHFAKHPDEPGFKQWKRKEWFLEKRLFPSGNFRNIALSNYHAQQKVSKHTSNERSYHGQWTFAGPNDWVQYGNNNGLGRANCIAVDPTNDQIIYVGTASGGAWKTTNGGSSWQNITPHLPNLFVNDIEIDPSQPQTVYLLTGESNIPGNYLPGHLQIGSPSLGILKSSNGGTTWMPTGLSFEQSENFFLHKLLLHPTNSNIQYVAGYPGIFKTTDGWNTWTQITTVPSFDIEFKPGNPEIFYACGATQLRRYTLAGTQVTTISDPAFSIFSTSNRLEIGVTDDDPDIVYVLGGSGGSYDGFIQSDNSGLNGSWTIKDTTQLHFNGQASYNMALVIDPNDYSRVWAGMVGFNRSYSEGEENTWTTLTTHHPDHHDAVYQNGVLYLAHDGGVVKSTDDGTTFQYISKGISSSEIYRISGTPQDPQFNVIGTQDCGFMKRTSNSTTFQNIGNGDGMVSIIDYTNPDVIWIVGQLGGALKFTTGFPPAENPFVPSEVGLWVTPMIMDPVDPDILFLGRGGLYRTSTGGGQGSWDSLGNPAVVINNKLNCLAQGVNDRNRLYMSSVNKIWRIENALTDQQPVFNDISSTLPNLFITDIEVNPSDKDELFVTFSGYSNGQKVYKSPNGGFGWINISDGLPNSPVNCIVLDHNSNNDDALYVGTDIGIFYYDDNNGEWQYFGNDMPSVNVTDLYINTAGEILAGTWGRGLWKSDLYSNCPTNITLTPVNDPDINGSGIKHYSASNNILSNRIIPTNLGSEIYYTAGNRTDLFQGFEAKHGAFFEVKTGDCPN